MFVKSSVKIETIFRRKNKQWWILRRAIDAKYPFFSKVYTDESNWKKKESQIIKQIFWKPTVQSDRIRKL